MPPAAGIALGLLDRALVDAGERPPASNHIPPSVKSVVRVDLWRRYCDAGTVSNSDKPDSKLRAFNRAVEKLLSLKAIGVWNDYVWTVSGQAGQVRTRA